MLTAFTYLGISTSVRQVPEWALLVTEWAHDGGVGFTNLFAVTGKHIRSKSIAFLPNPSFVCSIHPLHPSAKGEIAGSFPN